jgi:hypothetical protein
MDSTSGEVGVMRLPPGFDPRRVVAATPDLEAHTGGMPGEQEPAPGALGGLPLQEMPGGDMERTGPGSEQSAGGMSGQSPGGASPGAPGGELPFGGMTGRATGGEMPVGAMTGPESGAELPAGGAVGADGPGAMPGEAGPATDAMAGAPEGMMPGEAGPGARTSGSDEGVALGLMNGGGAGSGPAVSGQGMPVGMDVGDPTEGLAEGMPTGAMEAGRHTAATEEVAQAAPAYGDGVTLEGRWRLTFSTITAGRAGD